MLWRLCQTHRSTILFVLLLLISLVFRLAITPLAIHGDLLSQAGWGWWIFHHGLFGFYSNNVWIYGWPSHPPLISALYGFSFTTHWWLTNVLVFFGRFIALHHFGANHLLWYYRFTNWFGNSMLVNTPFRYGEIITLKLYPILADLIVAVVIYCYTKQQRNALIGLGFAALYLLLPFSWYESALWGQNDQISFLVLLLAIYFLYKQRVLFASLLYVLSISLKPTTLIFLPLVLILCWKNRAHWKQLGASLGLVILAIIATWRSFSNQPFWYFAKHLEFVLFQKGEVSLWYNSFNFWHIITGQFTPADTHFLFLSLATWGWLLFLAGTAIILCVIQYNSWRDLLFALFAITFLAFLFQPRMHERYLYTAIVTGLLLAVTNRKIFWYWLGLMAIYTINLYSGWWFPPFLDPLHRLLDWQHGLIGTILSVGNLGLFFAMAIAYYPMRSVRAIRAGIRQRLYDRYEDD